MRILPRQIVRQFAVYVQFFWSCKSFAETCGWRYAVPTNSNIRAVAMLLSYRLLRCCQVPNQIAQKTSEIRTGLW